MNSQPYQREWNYLWSVFEDKDAWLFRDWIYPNRREDFSGKVILDAGCGPGHHIRLVAEFARKVIGVDLNTSVLAQGKLADLENVQIFKGDIASWDIGERFDVVYSVGVIHHTLDPDRTVRHLIKLLRPGGRLIIWVWSLEGNAMVRWILEPLKSVILRRLPRTSVLVLSHLLTLALYPVIHIFYRFPIPFLPYYEYFRGLRKSSYQRKQLNVFDKLNAPTTHFISLEQAQSWLRGLENTHLSSYLGTSWRVSGSRPLDQQGACPRWRDAGSNSARKPLKTDV